MKYRHAVLFSRTMRILQEQLRPVDALRSLASTQSLNEVQKLLSLAACKMAVLLSNSNNRNRNNKNSNNDNHTNSRNNTIKKITILVDSINPKPHTLLVSATWTFRTTGPKASPGPSLERHLGKYATTQLSWSVQGIPQIRGGTFKEA